MWEDLRQIPSEELDSHFPNIIEHCRQMGYDVYNECIPVVPAQHYFMGGIRVDHESRTSMPHLYAVGETACNGVHGKNRLASNSLLESLVFAKRAAQDMAKESGRRDAKAQQASLAQVSLDDYRDGNRLEEEYRVAVQKVLGVH